MRGKKLWDGDEFVKITLGGQKCEKRMKNTQ